MSDTRQIHATEAHYGLLVDIQSGRVHDQFYGNDGDTPHLDVADGRLPIRVAAPVWDMEQLGWCWRPVDSQVWQLTDTGRAALEGSGL